MELTIDDCMVLAARESATEPELRAAVCVAVGQALHHRYEANGYNEAAEVARRDADRFLANWHSAKRERNAAQAEAKAARESTEEARELLRIARDDAEMFARQRDEARSRASMLAQDLARAVEEREAFSLRASAAERERDEARAERDAALARPTYEARTVAPTPEEATAHEGSGAMWFVRTEGGGFRVLAIYGHTLALGVSVATWLPLGADGLPCAWPVAGEVSP